METLTINQYQLLTDWYLSALDGIADTDGNKSIKNLTNSLEWIAGHLLVARYNNIKQLGGEIEPYAHIEKFINPKIAPPRNNVAFNVDTKYPTLSECCNKWIEYSDIFIETLKKTDETILNKELPFNVLTGGKKLKDALKFLVLHETYHIGQMGIFRKALGYEPMLLGWRN